MNRLNECILYKLFAISWVSFQSLLSSVFHQWLPSELMILRAQVTLDLCIYNVSTLKVIRFTKWYKFELFTLHIIFWIALYKILDVWIAQEKQLRWTEHTEEGGRSQTRFFLPVWKYVDNHLCITYISVHFIFLIASEASSYTKFMVKF